MYPSPDLGDSIVIMDALHTMFRRKDGYEVNVGEFETNSQPVKLRLAPGSTLNTPYDMFANVESVKVDSPVQRIAELSQPQTNSVVFASFIRG